MVEEGYWQIVGRGWWRTRCTYLDVGVVVVVVVTLFFLKNRKRAKTKIDK
jgi:hypothetical protein